MKRFACLCGGLAVLLSAQSAKAQVVTTNNGLTIFYDVRPMASMITSPSAPFTEGQSCVQLLAGKKNFVDNVAAGNLGGPGDGDVLRISPRLRDDPGPLPTGFGLHVTKGAGKKGAFVDNSVGNLYAYITVEANGAGLDQVISALGRDTDVVKQGGAGAGNKIESILLTPDTAEWSASGTFPLPSALATQAGDDFSMSAKSVKIPVSIGPVYDATLGAVPAGVYRVACLQVTASTWNKGSATPPDSTYAGHDKVNNLLMTRAVSSGGPAPAELPDFGYTVVNLGDVEGNICNNADPGNVLAARDDFVTGSNGGTPEASNVNAVTPGLFTGVDIGASSMASDFTVVVQMRGDYNHDGTVTAADVAPRNQAILAAIAGTIRQRELYLGDFNNDGTVNAADGSTFNKNITAAAGGDCSTNPADCQPSGLALPGC